MEQREKVFQTSLFPVRDKYIFHLKIQSLSQLVTVHHQSHGVHKITILYAFAGNSNAMNTHRFRCK